MKFKHPPRLLPLGSMAAVLGIPAADLRAEAESGRVPCTRVGRKGLLFDTAAVQRLLLRRAGLATTRARRKEEQP